MERETNVENVSLRVPLLFQEARRTEKKQIGEKAKKKRKKKMKRNAGEMRSWGRMRR